MSKEVRKQVSDFEHRNKSSDAGNHAEPRQWFLRKRFLHLETRSNRESFKFIALHSNLLCHEPNYVPRPRLEETRLAFDCARLAPFVLEWTLYWNLSVPVKYDRLPGREW